MDARIAQAAHEGARRVLRGFDCLPLAVREELAQEAALRAFVTPDVLDPTAFGAEVGRNLAIDCLRRERPTTAPVDLEEAVPFARRMEARMDLARVAARIATGPRTHRETLVALVFEERTIDELVGDAGDDRGRASDVWYKRRRRATAWAAQDAARPRRTRATMPATVSNAPLVRSSRATSTPKVDSSQATS